MSDVLQPRTKLQVGDTFDELLPPSMAWAFTQDLITGTALNEKNGGFQEFPIIGSSLSEIEEALDSGQQRIAIRGLVRVRLTVEHEESLPIVNSWIKQLYPKHNAA